MSQTYVCITNGSYRNAPVNNVVFPLVKQYQHGANGGFVTVDGSSLFGADKTKIRVKVESFTDIVESNVEAFLSQVPVSTTPVAKYAETDEQIMERIAERFDILHEMAAASARGNVRAMIVTGPAGIGKSFGVIQELERSVIYEQIKGRRLETEIIKGAATPIGLYQILYNHRGKDNVLVFDDCDMLFFDDLSLNLLKAALDTGKKRKICWNSESRVLKEMDIPNTFDFNGSVIFITNLKFDNIKSKKLQDHLVALESRCHYLDLTLDTPREKLLRIRQIAATGELFDGYGFDEAQEIELIEFLALHQDKLREISLRTALKLADLYVSFPSKWQSFAKTTIMKM